MIGNVLLCAHLGSGWSSSSEKVLEAFILATVHRAWQQQMPYEWAGGNNGSCRMVCLSMLCVPSGDR